MNLASDTRRPKLPELIPSQRSSRRPRLRGRAGRANRQRCVGRHLALAATPRAHAEAARSTRSAVVETPRRYQRQTAFGRGHDDMVWHPLIHAGGVTNLEPSFPNRCPFGRPFCEWDRPNWAENTRRALRRRWFFLIATRQFAKMLKKTAVQIFYLPQLAGEAAHNRLMFRPQTSQVPANPS